MQGKKYTKTAVCERIKTKALLSTGNNERIEIQAAEDD